MKHTLQTRGGSKRSEPVEVAQEHTHTHKLFSFNRGSKQSFWYPSPVHSIQVIPSHPIPGLFFPKRTSLIADRAVSPEEPHPATPQSVVCVFVYLQLSPSSCFELWKMKRGYEMQDWVWTSTCLFYEIEISNTIQPFPLDSYCYFKSQVLMDNLKTKTSESDHTGMKKQCALSCTGWSYFGKGLPSSVQSAKRVVSWDHRTFSFT